MSSKSLLRFFCFVCSIGAVVVEVTGLSFLKEKVQTKFSKKLKEGTTTTIEEAEAEQRTTTTIRRKTTQKIKTRKFKALNTNINKHLDLHPVFSEDGSTAPVAIPTFGPCASLHECNELKKQKVHAFCAAPENASHGYCKILKTCPRVLYYNYYCYYISMFILIVICVK